MKGRVCAVLVTAALAGCGTGGGGSGSPNGPVSPPVSDSSSPPSSDSSSPPASLEFPTLATVRGSDVRVSSAITPGGTGAGQLRDRVTASADGAGNFTFRVNDPVHGPYTFTVNVPPNYSSIFLEDASRAGSFDSLLYSAVGVWSNKMNSGAGAAIFGVATGRADLPTTGTAQYSGQFRGQHRDDTDLIRRRVFFVHASASSLANFGTGVVSFATANSYMNDGSGDVAAPQLNLTGSMTGARENQMRGSVSTANGMTGDIRANFFGPASATKPPPEMAGSVAVRSGGATNGGEGRSMIGGFVMKR
jgi:hypothetical protein